MSVDTVGVTEILDDSPFGESSDTAGIAGAVRLEEYFEMLNVCKDDRERLLIRLLWATAGRVSEVLDLKPMNIIADDTLDLLNEKQHKRKDPTNPNERLPIERKTVYVPAEIVEDMRVFARAHNLSRRSYFFTGRDGKTMMNRRRALRMVKAIAERAGVFRERDTPKMGRRITACYVHLFRHGTAVEMLEQGLSLGSIQRHLGHASIQTTGIYAKVSDRARRLETVKLRV